MDNAPTPASSPSPGSKAAGKRKMTDDQIRIWYAKQPRVANDDSDDERAFTQNDRATAAARQASLNALNQASARGIQLQERFENEEEPDDVDDLFDNIYDDEVMVEHPYCPGMRCTEREREVIIELEEARRELEGPRHAEQAAEDAADDGTDTDETPLLVHYRNSAIQNAIQHEAVAEILFPNEQATGDSFEGEVA